MIAFKSNALFVQWKGF